VDEAVVDPGLLGEPTGRDAGVADVDEQLLRRVEERILRGRAGRGLSRGLDYCTSSSGLTACTIIWSTVLVK
jgi:hypothetical protein